MSDRISPAEPIPRDQIRIFRDTLRALNGVVHGDGRGSVAYKELFVALAHNNVWGSAAQILTARAVAEGALFAYFGQKGEQRFYIDWDVLNREDLFGPPD